MSPHPLLWSKAFCDPLSYHINIDTSTGLFLGGSSKASLRVRQLLMFAIYTLENQPRGWGASERETVEWECRDGTKGRLEGDGVDINPPGKGKWEKRSDEIRKLNLLDREGGAHKGIREQWDRQKEESRETPHGERRGLMQSRSFVAAHWDTDAF